MVYYGNTPTKRPSRIDPYVKNMLIVYAAAITVAILLTLIAVAIPIAYNRGIRHAIEDSVIYTVDIYNPDDPESSAWNGYDQLIYIELDDNTYVHGMYQG